MLVDHLGIASAVTIQKDHDLPFYLSKCVRGKLSDRHEAIRSGYERINCFLKFQRRNSCFIKSGWNSFRWWIRMKMTLQFSQLHSWLISVTSHLTSTSWRRLWQGTNRHCWTRPGETRLEFDLWSLDLCSSALSCNLVPLVYALNAKYIEVRRKRGGGG